MAEPTNELILKVLMQIQETQGVHTRVLGEHTENFVRLERRMQEMQDSMVTALRLAGHANIRHDTVSERLEDLTRRVETLEQAK